MLRIAISLSAICVLRPGEAPAKDPGTYRLNVPPGQNLSGTTIRGDLIRMDGLFWYFFGEFCPTSYACFGRSRDIRQAPYRVSRASLPERSTLANALKQTKAGLVNRFSKGDWVYRPSSVMRAGKGSRLLLLRVFCQCFAVPWQMRPWSGCSKFVLHVHDTALTDRTLAQNVCAECLHRMHVHYVCMPDQSTFYTKS